MSKFKAGSANADHSQPRAKSTLGEKPFMRKDSAGIESGLSERRDLDVDTNPQLDMAVNPLTGNPIGRLKPRGYTTVKEKGKSFEIED